MKKYSKTMSVIAFTSIVTLLSACNSGSSDSPATSNSSAVPFENVETGFSFPDIAEANGVISVAIPEGPLPAFSARRTLSAGSGSMIAFDDPVVLKYNIYSWSTGEIVESTDTFDVPITVRAGVSEGIPDFVSKSLLGRNIGDKLQLVFETGMEDLPEYLDPTDAYVMVLDLI